MSCTNGTKAQNAQSEASRLETPEVDLLLSTCVVDGLDGRTRGLTVTYPHDAAFGDVDGYVNLVR
jgi:hypothetical protein